MKRPFDSISNSQNFSITPQELNNEESLATVLSNGPYAANALNSTGFTDFKTHLINRCVSNTYDACYQILLTFRHLTHWYRNAVDEALRQLLHEEFNSKYFSSRGFQLLAQNSLDLLPLCLRSNLQQTLIFYFNATRYPNDFACQAFVQGFNTHLDNFKALCNKNNFTYWRWDLQLGNSRIRNGGIDVKFDQNSQNDLRLTFDLPCSAYLLMISLQECLKYQKFSRFITKLNIYGSGTSSMYLDYLQHFLRKYQSFDISTLKEQLLNILHSNLLADQLVEPQTMQLLTLLVEFKLIELASVIELNLIEKYLTLLHASEPKIQADILTLLAEFTRENFIDQSLIEKYQLAQLAVAYSSSSENDVQVTSFRLIEVLLDLKLIDESFINDLIENFIKNAFGPDDLDVENLFSNIVKQFPNAKKTLLEKLTRGLIEKQNSDRKCGTYGIYVVLTSFLKEGLLDQSLTVELELGQKLVYAARMELPSEDLEPLDLLLKLIKRGFIDKTMIDIEFFSVCIKNTPRALKFFNCMFKKSWFTKVELITKTLECLFNPEKQSDVMRFLAYMTFENSDPEVGDLIDGFVLNETSLLEKIMQHFPTNLSDALDWKSFNFLMAYAEFFQKLATKGYIDHCWIREFQLMEKFISIFDQLTHYPVDESKDDDWKFEYQRVQEAIIPLFHELLKKGMIEESFIEKVREMLIQVFLSDEIQRDDVIETFTFFFLRLAIRGSIDRSLIIDPIIEKFISIFNEKVQSLRIYDKKGEQEVVKAIVSLFDELLKKNLIKESLIEQVQKITKHQSGYLPKAF